VPIEQRIAVGEEQELGILLKERRAALPDLGLKLQTTADEFVTKPSEPL
jgi:hypothetical protein